MTGRTERRYRRRAHYPARINFGVTAELRAALEALADKADTCVAEVAQRTKGWRTVNRRPYGETMSAKRARWRRLGLCRCCGDRAEKDTWPQGHPRRVDARRQAERLQRIAADSGDGAA